MGFSESHNFPMPGTYPKPKYIKKRLIKATFTHKAGIVQQKNTKLSKLHNPTTHHLQQNMDQYAVENSLYNSNAESTSHGPIRYTNED